MADNECGEVTEEEDVHELMIELRRSEPGNYSTHLWKIVRCSRFFAHVAMWLFDMLNC